MSRTRRGLALFGHIRLVRADWEDRDFCFEALRASMRPYVVQAQGRWDEDWQRERFEESFHPSLDRIIEIDGARAGVWRVEEREDHLFLERIFLLPKHQGNGVGSTLVRALQDRARQAGLPVRLRVQKVNPARRLYERLGFRVTRGDETDWFLEWTPREGDLADTPLRRRGGGGGEDAPSE